MTPILRPLLATLLALACLTSLIGQTREELWQKVEQAEAQRLPRTALTHLAPIIENALAAEDHAEAIKAIAKKIVLETEIQGSQTAEAIARLQAQAENAPEALQPVFQTLLAQSFWNYFQQNRWRFYQRTQTVDTESEDFRSWDLPRILREIDHHFTAALANKEHLQSVPIQDYDALLEEGAAPDSYRPTLYDFLVHEALEFYQAGELGAIAPENPLEFTADSPLLAPAFDFMTWQVPLPGNYSPEFKAIRLYQDLLLFHQNDTDRSAFLDADLARLNYARNVATGEDRDQRHRLALETFIKNGAQHELSSLARAHLAQHHYQNGDYVTAREIAQAGAVNFPESIGGHTCHNLIQQIEAKSVEVTTEAVWNAPFPDLSIAYRNIENIYFRAYAADTETYLRHRDLDLFASNAEKHLASAPVLAWQAELPSTDDYQERTETLPSPDSLEPGLYYIVASANPEFTEHENQLSVTTVWVSNLALVVRSEYNSKNNTDIGGLLLDAESGKPITGASVQVWDQTPRDHLQYEPGQQTTTDSEGRFVLKKNEQSRHYFVFASHENNSIATRYNYHYSRGQSENYTRQETVFFTDRALYRPGQTIHYKGISYEADKQENRYATLPNESVTVVLLDPNRQEVASITHQTNDYGSFSGSFTAPSGSLNGAFYIRTIAGPSGASTIYVEEYKRPKFQAELLAPQVAPKLGEPATITGKATAYTGAAIDGAKVAWRVERSIRPPSWCWWWQPQGSQAIAHGETATAADGTFSIEFKAEPDLSIDPALEPTFLYTIYADITDSSGETRSAQRVTRAGYTALQASLHFDHWQTTSDPVHVSVKTSTLDGEPQEARGTLKVYRLQQPDTVERSPLQQPGLWWRSAATAPEFDPSNPATWQTGKRHATRRFSTDSAGEANLSLKLPAGPYRLELETKDRFGKTVTARSTVTVIDPQADRFTTKIPHFVATPTLKLEPGQTFNALWGTGYPKGQAYVEFLHQGKTLQSYWTPQDQTQSLIEFPITEAHRGGLTLRTTFVHENRVYSQKRRIHVSWTNKQLDIKWERFRSKLQPGQSETWTATLTGPDAAFVAAEMVAGLYDASLDQYRPHGWRNSFDRDFLYETHYPNPNFTNEQTELYAFAGRWATDYRSTAWSYRRFPSWLTRYAYHSRSRTFYGGAGGIDGSEEVFQLSPFQLNADADEGYKATSTTAGSRLASPMAEPAPPPSEAQEPNIPDLSQVSTRTNLNETAFFYPHLLSDENGVVKIQFTIPEALTQWRFFGFAHDNELRSGFLTDTAVTAKDLMVQPNPPRFLREGDQVEFSVKVSNQSDTEQSGQVRLTFADAATLASADGSLSNLETDRSFTIPAKESRSFSWRIKVPDGAGVLTYKAVGATDSLSDGEEGFLPVLSRRILVTESLSLPIRGPGSKTFTFDKLLASADSETLQHQNLSLQMVSQPAWYAVMALPYLMEFPHECSEQIFSRYYANALGSHIANSDPKIRRTFDLWKNTDALDSPLEKNQELKSVLIEETPWLRDAKNESQARRQIGLLFDQNRLADESARALKKLAERQLPDGRWSWFPGGRANDYITLHIASGFARLRNLGATADVTPALRSLDALDQWMSDRHKKILEDYKHPESYVPSHYDAFYLYTRSFYLHDRPIPQEHKAAIAFFQLRAREHWTKVSSRQSEAHLALALQRFGDANTPSAILRSLKERSISDEEFGMYWRDTEGRNWWWHRAPIETQALMIEAFAEIAQDEQAVEDLQVWLLKQKQTQNWKTTKATADAVYAILLRGQNLLASDALVQVTLGDHTLPPQPNPGNAKPQLGTHQPDHPHTPQPGTGFYHKTFTRQEIQPEMGNITLTKADAGVSWGSLHWQYLEDVSQVTPHTDTPLSLKKTLYRKENSSTGPILKPVTAPLSVGDELVVRIELRADRDMEYLHLKDQRGSGTEPTNVLSRYRWQDGLGYYESTRDTASHFFIDYLPKGAYVFEYSTRVQLKGRYQSGIASIQCMYAPEFNSHSQSIEIVVD